MENKHLNIIEELKELGVPLEHKPGMPFTVPAAYFDKLPTDTLQLIQALDYIENLPKKMPQDLPDGFFEKMQREVLDETAALEFETQMPKSMPQQVPAGYFDQSKQNILASIQTEEENRPTLTLTPSYKKRSWALAATMALLLSAGLFFINSSSSSLNLESELSKVSIEEIDSYINEHNYDFEAYDILENPQVTSQTLQSLEEEILQATENMSNEELFEFVL